VIFEDEPLREFVPEEATNEESLSVMWELGVIAPWFLRDEQLEVYDHIRGLKRPFLECARRWGKSTIVLVHVLEQLRQNPGWVCRWIMPEKAQARDVLQPLLEAIQETCPEHLKFKFKVIGSRFVGPNGSFIQVYGVDKDRGKRLRGPFAHIIVCDEYGFWSHPHVVKSILSPQLLTTGGQLVMASTPSEDLAHPYYPEREQAKRESRFMRKTIFDNTSLDQEAIDQAVKDAGGEKSEVWLREYLCLDVPNATKLVVKEWGERNPEDQEGQDVLPEDFERPAYFIPMVGGDSGFDDNTGLLFGYYDFERDWDVFEEELVLSGEATKDIIDQAKALESRLWGHLKDREGQIRAPKMRVYDASKQLLFDISETHKYPVVLPDKADLHAAIHAFRRRVQEGRVKVSRKCPNLLRQLRVGMWKNEQKTDFTRSKENGHLDALAAAIYFNRHLDRRTNPFPQKGLDPTRYHTFGVTPANSEQKNLSEVFAPFGGYT